MTSTSNSLGYNMQLWVGHILLGDSGSKAETVKYNIHALALTKYLPLFCTVTSCSVVVFISCVRGTSDTTADMMQNIIHTLVSIPFMMNPTASFQMQVWSLLYIPRWMLIHKWYQLFNYGRFLTNTIQSMGFNRISNSSIEICRQNLKLLSINDNSTFYPDSLRVTS